MGQTNLKHALQRKYALMAGELKEKAGEVVRIQTLFEQLPALSGRAQRQERLLECAEELLKEIDPAWTPDKVKPLRPNVHKAPIALGRISKTALDVLREANAPLTTRQVADALLTREGVGEVDSQARQRVINSVDTTLRAKTGRVVQSDDGWPKRWSVITQH